MNIWPVASGVAWRTLKNVLTTPALVIPSLMFPLLFFIAFAGGLSQVQNTTDALNIKGLEFTVQQPLDVLTSYLKGFGVSANYTKVKQSGANVATGVPPYTYNLAAYYEGKYGGLRVTKAFTKGSQSSGAGQNGITNAAFFTEDYSQVDFTSRLNLGEITGWKRDLQLTFDIFNVTRSIQRTNFQFSNAPYAVYEPGRTYQVGLRTTF